MIAENTSSPLAAEPVRSARRAKRSQFAEVLFWIIGIVLAFVVPLALVLGAIFVSSWGIPLPFEVRVP